MGYRFDGDKSEDVEREMGYKARKSLGKGGKPFRTKYQGKNLKRRQDIPIGKVMDLIIAQSKTSRMADAVSPFVSPTSSTSSHFDVG